MKTIENPALLITPLMTIISKMPQVITIESASIRIVVFNLVMNVWMR